MTFIWYPCNLQSIIIVICITSVYFIVEMIMGMISAKILYTWNITVISEVKG